MREMVYERNAECVLDEGTFLGFDYVIVSYGIHPCTYVRIPEKHPLYAKHYLDYTSEHDIDCHGGITYTGNGLYRKRPTIEKDGWWIGWDYSHIDDYSAIYGNDLLWGDYKRWTTVEILNEVKRVITQLSGGGGNK